MHARSAPDDQALVAFNLQVLAQARGLVQAHLTPGAPCYAGTVGAHLRHIVEHHAALLLPAQPGTADYDARPRDQHLESDPAEALRRLALLSQALQADALPAMDAPLQVLGIAGVQGDSCFAVPSSFGRELAFVASHAVHHFALLAAHCQRHGIPLPTGFGKAPATVAHERTLKETPCLLPA